jgi:hypothetical protein
MKPLYSLAMGLVYGVILIQIQAEDIAPVDRPVESKQSDMERLLAPYAEMSRKAYPEAKARYLAGLLNDYTFYVTIPIRDEQTKRFEQVYLQVTGISNGIITGKLASQTKPTFKYKMGDAISCNESDVRDWTISAPDGSEEGNFIGKFLDVFQDKRVPLIIKVTIDQNGGVKTAQFQAAINRYKQDVSFCIPDSVKREAEQIMIKSKQEPQETTSEKFAYVVYNIVDRAFEDSKQKQ